MTRSEPAPPASTPLVSDRIRRRRGWAALVLGLETLALLVMASVVLFGARGHELPRSFVLGLAAFLALFALLVGLAAVSVLRGGRFGVGFGITWQMFQSLASASLLRGSLYLSGAFGLISAIVAFVLLLNLARDTPTPLDEE